MLHCENKAKLVIGKYRRTGTVRPEGGGRGGVPLLYFTRYFKTYLWFSSSDAFYSIHLGGLASAGCCYVRTKCQIARARWSGRSRRALSTWRSRRSRKALSTIVSSWSRKALCTIVSWWSGRILGTIVSWRSYGTWNVGCVDNLDDSRKAVNGRPSFQIIQLAKHTSE